MTAEVSWISISVLSCATNGFPSLWHAPQPKRGSDIIIIHPGSRFLRIGRASDAYPVTIPHVIARKFNTPPNPPTVFARIRRVATSSIAGKKGQNDTNAMDTDEPPPNVVVTNDDDDEDAVLENNDDPVRLLYLFKS